MTRITEMASGDASGSSRVLCCERWIFGITDIFQRLLAGLCAGFLVQVDCRLLPACWLAVRLASRADSESVCIKIYATRS